MIPPCLSFHPTIDTSFTYYDTLRIQSDDKCNGSAAIAIQGSIQEVFSIRDHGTGKTRIKQITLRNTCPGDVSDPSQAINWYNLTSRNVIMDHVRFPSTIIRVGMPKVPPAYTLRPSSKFAENQKYLRFKPAAPGLVNNDPIIFYLHLKDYNCLFVDTLRWSGRGLD